VERHDGPSLIVIAAPRSFWGASELAYSIHRGGEHRRALKLPRRKAAPWARFTAPAKPKGRCDCTA
jgi:hypothetical protein